MLKISDVALVVSAYNEDISWIKKIKNSKIIYNKSNKKIKDSIPLENIGRESHTYLHHIVKNYDKINDFTIFCQGHPFDHCPQFIEIANCKSIESINKVSKKHNEKNYSETVESYEKNWPEIMKHYAPIGHSWTYDIAYHFNKPWDLQFRIPHTYIALEVMYPRHKPFKKFECFWGAIFAVSKENIHRFPKEKYQRLLDLHKEFWSMPWAMETIWHYIFCEADAPKEYF